MTELIQSLPLLGEGRNRRVYQLDDKYVIKEAVNQRGITANFMEVFLTNAPELADNPYIVQHLFYKESLKYVIRKAMTPYQDFKYLPYDINMRQLENAGIIDLNNRGNWYKDENGQLKLGDYGIYPCEIKLEKFINIFPNYVFHP